MTSLHVLLLFSSYPLLQYDEVFAQVAGRLGGLDPFLDAFFSFLHRRTDFYIEFDPVRMLAHDNLSR